jgi:hypothetical protein
MHHRQPRQMPHYIHYDAHGISPLKQYTKEQRRHERRTAQLQLETINLIPYSAYPLTQKVKTLETIIQVHDRWLHKIEISCARSKHTMEECTGLEEEHGRRLKNYRDAIQLAAVDLRMVADSGTHRLYKARLDAVAWTLDACESIFHGIVDVGLVVKLNYCLGGGRA